MIHVKVWSGSRSARITNMDNAGKRGQFCNVLRISGTPWSPNGNGLAPEDRQALDWSQRVFDACYALAPSADHGGILVEADYWAVRKIVCDLVQEARAAGVPEWACAVYDETCKGIHAPRTPLSAGVPGKWSGHADETGISLLALDDINEWAEITPHDQAKARAYEIAAKVWPKVQAAKTLSQAADILRTAGAKLHGYCRMD